MKTIPSYLEKQRDMIENVQVIGILKFGDKYTAHIMVNGFTAEYKEGDTLLSDYYILDVREERVILTKGERYYVLRP